MVKVLRMFLVCVFTALPAVTFAGSKVALVIGNNKYRHVTQLPQVKHDADLLTDALEGLGFRVIAKKNLDRTKMYKTVADFRDAARDADVSFVYYAGHGVQVGADNFLVPVDARLEEAAAAPAEAVTMSQVLDAMRASGARLNVLVLDACRNNPFVNRWTGPERAAAERGLRVEDAPQGFVVAFATAPGDTAADNGNYARSLVNHLTRPCVDLGLVFDHVFDDVVYDTNGGQVPWYRNASGVAWRVYYPAGRTGQCAHDMIVGRRKPEKVGPKLEPLLTWSGSSVRADMIECTRGAGFADCKVVLQSTGARHDVTLALAGCSKGAEPALALDSAYGQHADVQLLEEDEPRGGCVDYPLVPDAPAPIQLRVTGVPDGVADFIQLRVPIIVNREGLGDLKDVIVFERLTIRRP